MPVCMDSVKGRPAGVPADGASRQRAHPTFILREWICKILARASSLGCGNSTLRSSRPERMSAGSRMSALLVAAMTCATPRLACSSPECPVTWQRALALLKDMSAGALYAAGGGAAFRTRACTTAPRCRPGRSTSIHRQDYNPAQMLQCMPRASWPGARIVSNMLLSSSSMVCSTSRLIKVSKAINVLMNRCDQHKVIVTNLALMLSPLPRAAS